MIVIGIDPGKKGAIAFMSTGTNEATVTIMPDTTAQKVACFQRFGGLTGSTAIIEKVQVMGKSFGAKAALSYGQGYGEIIGILTALGVRIVEVSAAVWKKGMNLDKDKNNSILKAERLFPNVSLYPTPRCTKPSDGMAEALLIAEYGRRMKL